MAEDIIQAKIVFDDTSLKSAMSVGGGTGKGGDGFAGAIAKTGFGLDTPLIGDIGAILSGIVLLGRELVNVAKAGFNKLVSASPHLQASLDLLNKTVKLILRPIGDVISSLMRPFLISWLRIVLPIYKSWREWFGEGGGAEARLEISEGFKEAWQGILNWDFEQVMGGLERAGKGFLDLYKSFWSEVLKPETDKFDEWWEERKKQFGTEGVFDTLGAMLRSAFLGAYDWLLTKMGLIGEEEEITTFKEAISATFGGAFDILKTKLEESGIWENAGNNFATSLVDALVQKIKDSVPDALKTAFDVGKGALEFAKDPIGIPTRGIMDFFGIGKDSEEAMQSEEVMSRIGREALQSKEDVNVLNEALMSVADNTMPDLSDGLVSVNATSAMSLADDKDGMVGHLKKTQTAFDESTTKAGILLNAVNKLNKTVVTTHIIRTIRVGG